MTTFFTSIGQNLPSLGRGNVFNVADPGGDYQDPDPEHREAANKFSNSSLATKVGMGKI